MGDGIAPEDGPAPARRERRDGLTLPRSPGALDHAVVMGRPSDEGLNARAGRPSDGSGVDRTSSGEREG